MKFLAIQFHYIFDFNRNTQQDNQYHPYFQITFHFVLVPTIRINILTYTHILHLGCYQVQLYNDNLTNGT